MGGGLGGGDVGSALEIDVEGATRVSERVDEVRRGFAGNCHWTTLFAVRFTLGAKKQALHGSSSFVLTALIGCVVCIHNRCHARISLRHGG